MDRVAKNLRLFFGYDATELWSRLRDKQRAERSVDIYAQIIDELSADLKAEEGKRGNLVLKRSNELTEAKETLGEGESQHKEIYGRLVNSRVQVSSVIECLKATLLSVFGKSLSVDEIRDNIRNDEKALKKVDKKIKAFRKEYVEAIFRQTAAIDPIRDLRFAIGYLEDEIAACHLRVDEINEYLATKIIEICEDKSPLQVQMLFDMGLLVDNPGLFIETVLDVHGSDQLDIDADALKEDDFLFERVEEGLVTERHAVQKALTVIGHGHHHRKVHDSQNNTSSWKKKKVEFNGLLEVSAQIKQKSWRPVVAVDGMSESASFNFSKGRVSAAEKLAERTSAQKSLNINKANQLLVMLT